MTGIARIAAAVACLVCVIGFSRAEAQSGAHAIQDFVAAKDKWPQRVGLPLRLEGRYTVFSPGEMRFAGCDVPFKLPNSIRRPRGDSKNVEVSGQLERRNGSFVFVVRDLRTRPSDHEMLAQKRATIDSSKPEEFYELAQWARERGKFYDDDELIQASQTLYESGLARAFDLLDEHDVEGMRALAAKVKEFGLGDRLRLQYLHEANRAAFEIVRKQPKPDYKSLLQTLGRELPGSREPLPPEHEALRKDYAKAPQLAYRLADDPTRRMLDRIFYSEVALAEIEGDAAEDGSNGHEIAARIEKQLPEMTDVAEQYRDRELAYLDSRIDVLSREQLFELSAAYVARGLPEKAADSRRRWLRVREQQAKTENPPSLSRLMEIGEDYLNLLQDERGAARMFQAAYEANPQLTAASDWLTDHGYELRDGRWSRPGERRTESDGGLAEAIHEGRVQAGMTGSQVRAALGGAPSSIVRIASAGQFSEIWLYEELRISVQLTRRAHEKELSVRRVTDAP